MLGHTVSHYRITGKLGSGGMGIVYEAEDVRLPRKVALKFLPEESAGRPRRRTPLSARSRHDRAAESPEYLHDLRDRPHEGRAFIAMECVEGVNLKTYMARHELSTSEIVEIALQIAAALGSAHAKGIVHRDIKPGNIIVGDERQ